jgi:hypothetical protein
MHGREAEEMTKYDKTKYMLHDDEHVLNKATSI